MAQEDRIFVDHCVEIAEKWATEVDIKGSFPSQSILALKQYHLLGALVPEKYGGLGCSLTEVAKICFKLSQACSSTGLIFAMHQIEVAMLLYDTSNFGINFLSRIANEQLLLASVTSEAGIGGSVRTSSCFIEQATSNFIYLNKIATTISYGNYADGLLITARRNIDASPGDQVLLTVTNSQYTLERTDIWNTMGMRGTCSDGFKVSCYAPNDQVSTIPFGVIAESIMLPVSHLLWSSVWLGIATEACTLARKYLREQTRKQHGNALPPSSNRLVNAVGKLQLMHSRIKNALSLYEQLPIENGVPVSSLSFNTEINGLKISISDMALDVVNESLMICGIQGYKNDSPYSLGRHLRDIHSARLMISNDRITNNMAGFLLVQRSPVLVF